MRQRHAASTAQARGPLPGLKSAAGPADHPQVDADLARDGALEREGSPRRVRIYRSIRTAHLERFRTMTPAAVLYVHRRYDFDPTLAAQAQHVRRLGRLATVVHLLRTEYDAVELNEPLALPRWADLAGQITAVRLRDALHRRRTTIGAYCIGLSDPVERLTARGPVPRALARRWSRLVLGALVRRTDRLAVGTEGTLTLLGRYVAPDVLARRVRLFPAVPAPCGCPPAPRAATTVVIVGVFAERKGIRQLMAAWERIPGDAGLRLRLLGKGPLLEEVRAWTAGRSDVDLVVDPPRDEIHATLRATHVLVLLSQRTDAWREQVGLPIVEGLAHGCEIVATDETGLADWLDQHGHRVVPGPASPDEVATAIRQAAASTRTAAQICADLPEEDTRWAADRWLLTDPEASGPSGSDGLRPDVGRRAFETPRQYARHVQRSVRRYGVSPVELIRRWDDRPVFVVGSSRSGTSFTAATIGTVSGFADLGELRPLKQALPYLVALPPEDAVAPIRGIIRRSQRLGFVTSRRGIEQTPESTFLIEALALAFPEGRFLHLVRDGRDVAASLIALGWMASGEQKTDEVGQTFGPQPRFWVEGERREEFPRVSEATRAAWVWRQYETTARRLLEPVGDRALEVRYERLVADPAAVARELASFLEATDRADEFVTAFGRTTGSAAGRWRRDLDAAQIADVEREAGQLLAALGYTG